MNKFTTILKSALPIALMLIPGHVGDILRTIAPNIADAMAQAQEIPGATNTEKKAHVMSVVEDGYQSIAASNTVVIPHDDLIAAASAAIDTTVDVAHVINGTHKAFNTTVTPATPATPAAPPVQ